ncbi:hypothetical protein SSBG_02173 [Streptomyces sp. SPB074]|nr:hypothetical protein SSBG_02173 [Streptomyces sp. SPB074]
MLHQPRAMAGRGQGVPFSMTEQVASATAGLLLLQGSVGVGGVWSAVGPLSLYNAPPLHAGSALRG